MSKYNELVTSVTETLLEEASMRLNQEAFGTEEWARAYREWWEIMEVIYELE